MTWLEHIITWAGMCFAAAMGGAAWSAGDYAAFVVMILLALFFLYCSITSIGRDS
jgi:hypothetical protein